MAYQLPSKEKRIFVIRALVSKEANKKINMKYEIHTL